MFLVGMSLHETIRLISIQKFLFSLRQAVSHLLYSTSHGESYVYRITSDMTVVVIFINFLNNCPIPVSIDVSVDFKRVVN